MSVDYAAAARRHIRDAHVLHRAGGLANAGQLLGFCVECGLKSLLVHAGLPVSASGDLQGPYRKHIPALSNQINALTVLPDGRPASVLHSRLPNLSGMANWMVDHRYWKESSIPTAASWGAWELAALEMDALLDEAAAGGVL